MRKFYIYDKDSDKMQKALGSDGFQGLVVKPDEVSKGIYCGVDNRYYTSKSELQKNMKMLGQVCVGTEYERKPQRRKTFKSCFDMKEIAAQAKAEILKG